MKKKRLPSLKQSLTGNSCLAPLDYMFYNLMSFTVPTKNLTHAFFQLMTKIGENYADLETTLVFSFLDEI